MISRAKFRHAISTCLLLSILNSASAPAQQTDENYAGTAVEPGTESDAGETEIAGSNVVRGRILPVPMIITEPAIGKGLGAGLIYFHGIEAQDRPRIESANSVGNTAKRGKPPPTATAIGGFYTNNETAGVALAHSRSLLDDQYRAVGILASMDIHATFYEGSTGFDFGLDGNAIFTRGQRRMGDSNLFLGLSLSRLDGTIGFDLPIDALPDNILGFDFTDVGVAVSAIHDSIDDSMMPGSGHLYDLTIWRHDDALGSDFNYTKSRLKLHWFSTLTRRFHLGFRVNVASSTGDAPFFAEPYVELRGIPALRYQGDSAGAVEIEGRYDISARWAAVAFAGAGFVSWDDETKADEDNIYASGVGIRYQLFTEQGVWVGIDLARGPEESNWYIQIGHPW